MADSQIDRDTFEFFSDALYRRPGVAKACLGLQDDDGLDVNFLLFCAYAGALGQTLGDADFSKLETAVAQWRSKVVRPLRAVRRGLSDEPESEALRQRVLEIEIEAELVQQRRMQASLTMAAGPPSVLAATGNFAAYLLWFGAEKESPLRQARISHILAQAFRSADAAKPP